MFPVSVVQPEAHENIGSFATRNDTRADKEPSLETPNSAYIVSSSDPMFLCAFQCTIPTLATVV